MKAHCIAAWLLGLAGSAVAAPAADGAARERLRLERESLQGQRDRAESACVARAAPRSCIDGARRAQRAALAPLRREEAALDAEQHRRQALDRAAVRSAHQPAPAERAQREERSRRAYEGRQRAAQAHRDAVAQRATDAASTVEPKKKPAAPLPVPTGAAP